MSTEAAKLVDKSGLRMTKDKILDIIRRSPLKEVHFSPCPNSKNIVIIVQQP